MRVIISGLGAVSALGGDLCETARALASRNLPVPQPSHFDPALALPVFTASPRPSAGDRELPVSRTCQLALQAAREALREAGDPHLQPGIRLGVCLGTTVASQLNNLPFYAEFRRSGQPPLEPALDFLKGNLAEVVARHFRASGPRATIVNACSSGAEAWGLAMAWLQAGLCDAVLAGGADELNRVPLCGFHALGVSSDQPCRPFDRDRHGLNLGEGAGIGLLESEGSARPRGLADRPWLAGYAAACDAHHLTAPHPQGRGLSAAIQGALRQAGIKSADIGFVNAHGTATPDNDRVEGRVLNEIFGPNLVFLSTKGYTGHTLGAAGGLEAVFTTLALREGWLPASAGFANLDPEINLAPTTERTPVNGDFALSTSLAFGGNNAALIVAAPTGKGSGRRPSHGSCACRSRPIDPVPAALSPLAVRGLGALWPRGRGSQSIEQALHEGWQAPAALPCKGLAEPICAYSIPDSLLRDKTVLRAMRRADRFSRMAALAARDAWLAGNAEPPPEDRVGLVLATGLGPHVRTFEFLDGILDFGDHAASPTAFSHSVHNAAASYVANLLQIRGPVQTITDFEFAFPQALETARLWLLEQRVDAVLLGAVEELGEVMLHVAGRLLEIPADGRPAPLSFLASPPAIPGEGAVFFLLSRSEGDSRHVTMETCTRESQGQDVDLTIVDAEGTAGDESRWRRHLPPAGRLANYSPLFGSLATGLAWQCACALVSLEQKIRFASPLGETSTDPRVCRRTEAAAEPRSIVCRKLGFHGDRATIRLRLP